MACLPATVATAYFIAVILLDLFTREWRRVPGHALFGVFAVLLLGFICEKGSEGMAWTLLLAPLIFLILGYFVRLLTAIDWKSYFIRSATGAEESARQSYFESECAAEPCECGKPCPRPIPRNPRPPCPACPKCNGSGSGGSGSGGGGSGGSGSGGSGSGGSAPTLPKPGSCIKGTLAD